MTGKPRQGGLLDGRALSKRMLSSLAPRVAALKETRGEAPLLAILVVGGDPTSQLYLKSKLDACRKAGIETTVQAMHAATTEAEACKVLEDLSQDANVDGVIVELPLPSQLRSDRILERLDPGKDVEGLTPANYGGLFWAKSIAELERSGTFVPCTPAAILALLSESGVAAGGKRAVVIGRSNIVGKPTAHLLSCLDATVTLCHSKTRDLKRHLKRADIVVTAVGRAKLVTGAMLKPGAVVIDAGIATEEGGLVGDVDFPGARAVAGFITPVPGGVGPVTIAALLTNTVLAAERRAQRRLAGR